MSTPSALTDYCNFIAGEFRPARSGEWLESVDPSTGRVWARVPASDATDIDDAVTAARHAFPDWRATPPLRRAALLRRWADAVLARSGELAAVESRDNGRVLKETQGGDVPGGAMNIQYNASLADKVTGDTIHLGGVPGSPPGGAGGAAGSVNFTVYEPYGVAGIIIPWNAPLAMFFAKVSGALAAGNTVVVKPAEQACCSILAACELFTSLDLPPGLVNVVSGTGPSAGEALVDHPGVTKLDFTGSTATGRRVIQRASANLKNVSLELGGKSPNIVFDEADLDAAVTGVAGGIYTGGAGQSCVAGSRVLIQDTVFDTFTDRLRAHAAAIRLGDPRDPATDMGPIAFAGQFDKVRGYLELGLREGAKVLFGGRTGADALHAGAPPGTATDPALAGGYWVEPTLLTTTDNGLRICQEEIFGPVAVAIPFATEEEAYAIANDTDYGLAAGAWTRSLDRAHRAIAALQAGTVWINTYRRLHWAVPFGGHKQSGNAPSNGVRGLGEWLTLKAAWVELGHGDSSR
ncbi:aldehyde dehydrogenase [Nocardiopsis gilva YIM 90087]|uniref:Aldehyde dehydrogenase n=1 Tax=Nocardiopsis gilva YIM 90087 TaxID=1235441 RepID=A0A223S4B7_9ACTN|nr:aldehyde dehydrogenase family protein [Nocardiopsis gilva]ASU82972.1 aldehyde dehydrogenase [Nocardiopsis gilva YIM 90087]